MYILFIHHNICRLQPSQFIPNSPDTLSNSIRIYAFAPTFQDQYYYVNVQVWEGKGKRMTK